MEKNPEEYRLLLFVATGQKNSIKAQTNTERFLKQHLKDQYVLKIIDVTEDPKLALDKGVYFTPMLMVSSPLPEAYLAGDMSDENELINTILH